ncbi:MAG: hypothetical protein WCI71_13435 [Bacteroidota bacterium]
MDARQEKLHQQVTELLKTRKKENDALRKIITAMEKRLTEKRTDANEDKRRNLKPFDPS